MLASYQESSTTKNFDPVEDPRSALVFAEETPGVIQAA